ncbi:hypothetical protein T265_09419 [Opisthorchis viverrini]|uniref:Uncharacterized protein n=1 Tax=Opisthorchis viverrini TaxID=6198 RepID=A0A074ZAB0_OPIVI|nr:hypothetical protein T265_09419 [Opisthorchis viverrini]KER22527.1 hypothetical protein T265_09419 [Opisthorchis viverrini]
MHHDISDIMAAWCSTFSCLLTSQTRDSAGFQNAGRFIDICTLGFGDPWDRCTTSVFNTDASLPYNHDLFESLIVKKRVKYSKAHAGPHPGSRVAPTAPKRFVISFILLCQAKGWLPLCLRHSELGMKNITLFGKRCFGIRNTCPNQRSFWCWTHSSMEVAVAQPKTRSPTASLRICLHYW